MKMKVIKRNAVILTVVLFLCAAVYLNWSYGKKEDQAALAGAAGSEEALSAGQDALEEVSLYYEPEESLPTANPVAAGSPVSDYFATARLTRQQARDSAVSLLRESTELENATNESIDSAMEAISVMAACSLQEAELESMIRAKGFDECVVFLRDDSVTVAVSAPAEGLSSAAVSRITDILLSETALTAEQIKIIEVK